MTPEQFLIKKGILIEEQNQLTAEINERFGKLAHDFLSTNTQFTLNQVVNINNRRMVITNMQPLTWFEIVMIRIYGFYLDDDGNMVEPENNGIALSDTITLSNNQEFNSK